MILYVLIFYDIFNNVESYEIESYDNTILNHMLQ